MSGALSAGINALITGARVSPFPSMQEMLAPQELNYKREAAEQNALLTQQDLDLKRLEYGLKLQDAAASRALSDSLLAGLNGNTPPGTGTGTATATASGGGFSSDKETARKQIIAQESHGDPTALNYVARQDPSAYARGATASGKYQFVNSTWREGMQLAGLDPSKYPTARDAPEAVQDQVFDAVYAKYGTKPWEQGPKDWVKDESGRYQIATVRPPPGSPGNPGGQTTAGATNTQPYTLGKIVPVPGTDTTDLNGPRPLPPVGYNRGEVVKPDTLANTRVPVDVNGLLVPQPQQRGVAARTGGVDTAGPGAPTAPPPQAPPPAPGASAASTYSVPPPAKPQEVGPLGLTHEQVQRYRPLLEAGGKGTAQVAQHMMETAEKNRTEQRQYQQDLAKWQNDRETWIRNQEADRYTRRAQEDTHAEAVRKADEAARASGQPIPSANTERERMRNFLLTADPKTPAYHATWAAYAEPHIGEGGLTVTPNMSAFKMPQDEDGNPVTTYDRPRITIGPGDLTKLRNMETQATTLIAALDDFGRTARDASQTERGKTLAGQPTDLRSAWTNAGLMAKGDALYQLGVLSGPDMQVIRGALADPSTFGGWMTSSATIDKQINRIKRLLETRIDQARQSYGGGMGAGTAPGQTQQQPSGAVTAPKAGEVQDGYRYKGGNPADPKSWEKAS